MNKVEFYENVKFTIDGELKIKSVNGVGEVSANDMASFYELIKLDENGNILTVKK